MSFSWWMNEQNVCPKTRGIHNRKKEWCAVTCSDILPQKRAVKGKNPTTKTTWHMIPFIGHVHIGQSMEMERRLVVAWRRLAEWLPERLPERHLPHSEPHSPAKWRLNHIAITVFKGSPSVTWFKVQGKFFFLLIEGFKKMTRNFLDWKDQSATLQMPALNLKDWLPFMKSA